MPSMRGSCPSERTLIPFKWIRNSLGRECQKSPGLLNMTLFTGIYLLRQNFRLRFLDHRKIQVVCDGL